MSKQVQFSTQKSCHENATAEDSFMPAEDHSSESPFAPFLHRDMVYNMMTTAQQHGRDFTDDAIRLITIYLTRHTINVDKILNGWAEADPHKHGFETMVNIYGIRSQTDYNEPHPTLARISEALPHLTLVMFDQIADGSQSISWPGISNEELGVTVHPHFKMNFYPGLVDVQVGGLKVKAGLLLFNLCFAKVLMKSSKGRMNSVKSFVVACRFASTLMAQQLAPSQSRRKFTEFVESLPLDARVMNEVWRRVLDDVTIQSTDAVCLTSFHRRVFEAQPLDLAMWKHLLSGIYS